MGWSKATDPFYGDVQLGRPGVRIWEVDESSTNFERQRAAPSDETLHRVWMAWSTFFFAFATFNVIVFLGIITARKVRRRPFNVYVIFLMVPDIVYTLSCAVQCAILSARGGFITPGSCQVQSFYLMFGLTANSWMNALVAKELRRLLTVSGRRARYKPPKKTKIFRDCLFVYLFSAVLAMISWLDSVPWWPHKTGLQNGLVCLPIAYDLTSSLVFWLVFFPIMSGVPLFYCAYVAWHVWYQNLLPPPGKRRELMAYFYRITGVFAIMWVPGVFFFYVSVTFPNVNVQVWAIYIASVWSHSQGAVAAAVSMLKEDVYGAVMNLVWCKGDWDNPHLRRPPTRSTSSFPQSMSPASASIIRSSSAPDSFLEGSFRMSNAGLQSNISSDLQRSSVTHDDNDDFSQGSVGDNDRREMADNQDRKSGGLRAAWGLVSEPFRVSNKAGDCENSDGIFNESGDVEAP